MLTLKPQISIRREFKIVGQIGAINQKDRFSFSSLMHQIEAGKSNGYTEKEIMGAVIKRLAQGLV